MSGHSQDDGGLIRLRRLLPLGRTFASRNWLCSCGCRATARHCPCVVEVAGKPIPRRPCRKTSIKRGCPRARNRDQRVRRRERTGIHAVTFDASIFNVINGLDAAVPIALRCRKQEQGVGNRSNAVSDQLPSEPTFVTTS